MSYALVVADSIEAEQGTLPDSARRLDTQEWVMGLPDAAVDLQHACGWFEVVDVAKPPDTASTTHDRSLTLVAGVPTVTWTERPKTQSELDYDTHTKNKSTNEQHLEEDLAKMQATIDTPNATINQSPASYIKDIARAMRRNIKHALNDFSTGPD